MLPTESPERGPSAAASGGILTIDLDALAANYRLLGERASPALCATVVKADAYGLGMARVAPALARAGCSSFFVATLDEGRTLRALLPGARIFILNGLAPGLERAFDRQGLIPVVNDLLQLDAWRGFARGEGERSLPVVLHIDTGMNRLGLDADEVGMLADDPGRLSGLDIVFVISHLACAEEIGSSMNREQLEAFNDLRRRLPPAAASIGNSSAIFLEPEYQLDMVRAGIAIYGSNPLPGQPNPMAQVIHLQGRIIQSRRVDSPMTVGYGASHKITGPGRLATVAVGYADGYPRALGNQGFAYIDGARAPVVGRISMDLLTLDVTQIDPACSAPDCLVDLLGGGVDIDEAAALAGSIGYELLTALGPRYHRIYLESGA